MIRIHFTLYLARFEWTMGCINYTKSKNNNIIFLFSLFILSAYGVLVFFIPPRYRFSYVCFFVAETKKEKTEEKRVGVVTARLDTIGILKNLLHVRPVLTVFLFISII